MNKTIAIMQPYFFPYLGYFQLMNAVDEFLFFDDVNYINRGFINRNSILLDGQAHRVTLSILGASQNKKINELFIGENTLKILSKIEIAYRKAPSFLEVFPILEKSFRNPEKNLARFLGSSLEDLATYLELNTRFLYSSDIAKDPTLKAEQKILDLCQKRGATRYINPIGGQDLYDRARFKAEGIELFFLHSHFKPYIQFRSEFVPHLSVIDVLMFNDKAQIKTFLTQYELV